MACGEGWHGVKNRPNRSSLDSPIHYACQTFMQCEEIWCNAKYSEDWRRRPISIIYGLLRTSQCQGAKLSSKPLRQCMSDLGTATESQQPFILSGIRL